MSDDKHQDSEGNFVVGSGIKADVLDDGSLRIFVSQMCCQDQFGNFYATASPAQTRNFLRYLIENLA